MHKGLHFDGRQIKNYLIGFASLFAEIPYKDRNGNIKIVPIHYGSPSDVISYLENSVDNSATANRNRLKDITVPMFSFRMTGLEKNQDKRRAPHDTITVDLRPLGYNTGYVAMRPAPYRFTMELTCWASSDYQAFEITEQIIPYFNSPQSVKIEPLPRCPISTTEIFLDNIEIDTEPESQKYSALITMTFSLTGFLLTQPKIWSTNMEFELSMLTDQYKGVPSNPYDVKSNPADYTVGSEIRDLNVPQPKLMSDETAAVFASVESFIRNTPEMMAEYGETLDWYNILVANNRIDSSGTVIDSTTLVAPYGDGEKTFYADTIMLVADKIEDVRYVYANKQIQSFMQSMTLEGNIRVLDDLYNDYTDTISVYLNLFDNNLVTSSFNTTNVEILNADKMRIFGTSRINVDSLLERLRSYLSALENLKMYKSALIIKGIFSEKYSAFVYENSIPYVELPAEAATLLSEGYLGSELPKLSIDVYLNKNNDLVLKTTPELEADIVLESDVGNSVISITTDLNGEYIVPLTTINLDKPFGLVLINPEYKPLVLGVVIRDLSVVLDVTTFDYSIFGIESSHATGIVGEITTSVELDTDFYRMSSFDGLLDNKFSELSVYIVASLVYNQIQMNSPATPDLLRVVKNKFKLDYDGLVEKAIELKHLIAVSEKYIDITDNSSSSGVISGTDYASGQQNSSTDLAQTVAVDKDGKPIYDINRDGVIDSTDLELLKSNVDNPEDYYYNLIYGIWYKKFRITDMNQERLDSAYRDFKTTLFILEKESYSEIADFMILIGKKLVTPDFNLYSLMVDSDKSREIKALGYDLDDLENNLLCVRMFSNALRTILVAERDYIAYRIGLNLSETGKTLLYKFENIDLDRLMIGKYLTMYFDTFATDEIRKENAKIITPYMSETLGYYMDYNVEAFDILISDISTTTLFTECLNANTGLFETMLPDINTKIITKYGLQP